MTAGTLNPFAKALERNRYKLAFAIANTSIVSAMGRSKTAHSFDFFRLAMMALHYDRVARAAKVFDRTRGVAGYFYLVKRKPDALKGTSATDLAQLEVVADGIKHIRNKTHFHLDQVGVLNPAAVWRKANITESQFRSALVTAAAVLDQMYRAEFGYAFAPPEFDTQNVRKIMRLAEEAGLLS